MNKIYFQKKPILLSESNAYEKRNIYKGLELENPPGYKGINCVLEFASIISRFTEIISVDFVEKHHIVIFNFSDFSMLSINFTRNIKKGSFVILRGLKACNQILFLFCNIDNFVCYRNPGTLDVSENFSLRFGGGKNGFEHNQGFITTNRNYI